MQNAHQHDGIMGREFMVKTSVRSKPNTVSSCWRSKRQSRPTEFWSDSFAGTMKLQRRKEAIRAYILRESLNVALTTSSTVLVQRRQGRMRVRWLCTRSEEHTSE